MKLKLSWNTRSIKLDWFFITIVILLFVPSLVTYLIFRIFFRTHLDKYYTDEGHYTTAYPFVGVIVIPVFCITVIYSLMSKYRNKKYFTIKEKERFLTKWHEYGGDYRG